jgi:hypothetical protein
MKTKTRHHHLFIWTDPRAVRSQTVQIEAHLFFSLPSPSHCLCLRRDRDMPGAATLRSRVAVAAAACLAVFAAVALLHRKRRWNRAPSSSRRLGVGGRPRRACEEEEKPQDRFKRVLADNSYSPFKHPRRKSAQLGSAEGEAPLPPPQGARTPGILLLLVRISALPSYPYGFYLFLGISRDPWYIFCLRNFIEHLRAKVRRV